MLYSTGPWLMKRCFYYIINKKYLLDKMAVDEMSGRPNATAPNTLPVAAQQVMSSYLKRIKNVLIIIQFCNIFSPYFKTVFTIFI
jgi:hypothetical protein